jgi:hypothetical protein
MKKQVFEIEDESLELVKKQAKAKISDGMDILSEVILCDGKPQSIKAVAESVVTAFEEARKMVPEGSEIIKENELSSPIHKTIEVRAFSEKKAKSKVIKLIEPTTKITGNRLRLQGRKGFLGIGRTSNIYEVDILQPAISEIIFKSKAKIRFEVSISLELLDKKELRDLLNKIYIYMSIDELIELIGKPSTTMSDSEMFSLYSNVIGATTPTKEFDKENWLYRTSFGNFQLIILNGIIIKKSDLEDFLKTKIVD